MNHSFDDSLSSSIQRTQNRLINSRNVQFPFRHCVPAEACMPVEDYCEPSVLRLRTVQPYVPLRRNIKRERV